MLDFEDIDLTDTALVDQQIAERHAVIDRLHGEIAALSGADIRRAAGHDD